jgi:hypothetical protein
VNKERENKWKEEKKVIGIDERTTKGRKKGKEGKIEENNERMRKEKK